MLLEFASHTFTVNFKMEDFQLNREPRVGRNREFLVKLLIENSW